MSVTRVVVVGPSLRYLGGQAVQAKRLLDDLATEPSVAATYLTVDPVLPGPFRYLQRLPVIRTLVTSLAYVAKLAVQLPRYDVVHAFSASYWSFLLAPTPAMLLGRLYGKRVVLHYHSGEADDHLTRWGWHAKPLMRLAHRIVVPTGYLVDVFGRHGLATEAIANHITIPAGTTVHREEPVPRFFSNRNFEAHYNVGAILEAFAMVRREFPSAELVVAGNGSMRAELERQATSLGLDGVCRFTGPVKPDAMTALYADADVYVNASLIDNMPLSLLEAYITETPVVTSDAGGIPWMAVDGETARVVPAGDVGALAVAMVESVVHFAASRSRARTSRSYVAQHFTWAAVRGRWLSAYGITPG